MVHLENVKMQILKILNLKVLGFQNFSLSKFKNVKLETQLLKDDFLI